MKTQHIKCIKNQKKSLILKANRDKIYNENVYIHFYFALTDTAKEDKMFVDLQGKTRIKLALHTPIRDKHPDDVVRAYLDCGFDAVALTAPWEYNDHGNVDGVKVLSGCEYSMGVVSDEFEAFHIIGVGMTSDPEIPPAWKNMKKTARSKAAEVVKMIKKRNGIAILCYPAQNKNAAESLLDIGEFDGIEIFNSESEYQFSAIGYAGEIVDRLALFGLRPFLIASNSEIKNDAESHNCALMVEATDMDSDHIIRAIRQGRFYSTEGPEIHVEKIGADKVRVTCSPVSKIQFFTDGERDSEKIVEGENVISAEYSIKKGERYVRAEVTDESGLMAWSNIVSFDELYR